MRIVRRKVGVIERVKTAARALFRTYDYKAAAVTRLTADWITSSSPSPNELTRANARILRARSRYLARNNAFIRQYLNLVAVNVIGPNGFGLDAISEDEAANAVIEQEWGLWASDPVTVDGRMDFCSLQRALIRAVARDGEVFVRLWRTREGLRLEPLDADLVDETYNVPRGSGAREVKMGIEVDAMSRPTAFFFWNSIEMSERRERVRVDASEVIHLFDPDRFHSVRGLPWPTPVMDLIKMLDGYMEAELVAARAGAAKMGFFVRKEGMLSGEAPAGDQEIEANPGSIEYAPDGFEFQSWDPDHPSNAFPEFTKALLRAIASGLGVSYPSLTGDLEAVNYSSMRGGLLIERDYWRAAQRWWIATFVRRVFAEWVDLAALSKTINVGTLDTRNYRRAARWTPRGFDYVDPYKDIQAIALAIDYGLTSRTCALREQGEDIEDVLGELAEEQDIAKENDLKIDGKKATVAAGGVSGEVEAEDGEPVAGRANGNGSALRKPTPPTAANGHGRRF